MSLPLGRIKDAHIDYVMKRVWVPAIQAVTTQVSGASTVLVAGWGATVPTYAQIGATKLGAVQLTQAADHVYLNWQIPYDFDNQHRLLVRHLWTSNYATANGTATFLDKYSVHKVGDAATAPATAMTVDRGASTKVSATADTLYWTPYSIIAPTTNAGQCFAYNSEFICWDFSCSATTGITIGTDFVFWLGTEFCYTPAMTFGDGSRREARQVGQNLSHTIQQIAANEV